MTFLGLEAEMLARIQFAFTVSFHFLFPAFSIGTASYLAVLNALWLWKRDEAYLKLFEYWKTIFAVTFAMGVVSGIVMSYQFGHELVRVFRQSRTCYRTADGLRGPDGVLP